MTEMEGGCQRSRELEVILFNIRSMRQNFKEFLAVMAGKKNKPAAIILTEIWIYSYEESVYNIDGYSAFINCQDDSAAGGVAIYVKNEYGAREIRRHKNNMDAIAVCSEQISRNRKTIPATIYSDI